MKKLFVLIVLTIALVSCYKDYVQDFDYSAVYFPLQYDVRTVVVGEGMNGIEIGLTLSGVIDNTRDRNVSYMLNNALITPALLTTMKASTLPYIKDAATPVTALLPLRAAYYTLSNTSSIVIKNGNHSGSVSLRLDSAAFLSDPATINATYVLPFYITEADADTILKSKRSLVVGIKYENMLFGNYLHGGVTTVKNSSGAVINTIRYNTYLAQPDNKIWKLYTTAPNKVVSNGYSDVTSTTKKEIELTINGSAITIASAGGSTNSYLANGTCTFNNAKLLQDRKIFLNYSYVAGANTNYCQDTLTFRNRIRDGVNEWQDENTGHYSN